LDILITSTLNSDCISTAASWQWHEWQGLPYLKCSLLEDWQHGFFSRQFAPRTPEALVEVLAPEATVYRVQQVHGNRVLFPAEIAQILADNPSLTDLVEADGLASDLTEAATRNASRPQQAIWVASADCNPVLIGDVVTKQVAAVHAGWRGTALKIVLRAIDRLLEMGSSLENLRIAIGPAITGEVYQVTEHTAAEVGKTLLKNPPEDIASILAAVWQIPATPFQKDPQQGRIRLDVRRVNQLQLERLGIAPANIAISPHCTYQQPEYFFSYRRHPEKKVQWSGIVS
jgi:polyphenol oxidase